MEARDVFVLVRHSHAGDKKLWTGDDVLRPLSGRGLQQAAGLVASLSGISPSRLVASPYLRCRQTLAPLSERLGLAVDVSDMLRPDADPAQLDRWLDGPALEGAVLCTHGETLTALFERWAVTRTVEKAGHGSDGSSTQKGAAWVVTTDDARTHAHYLRPLHVGPALTATG